MQFWRMHSFTTSSYSRQCESQVLQQSRAFCESNCDTPSDTTHGAKMQREARPAEKKTTVSLRASTSARLYQRCKPFGMYYAGNTARNSAQASLCAKAMLLIHFSSYIRAETLPYSSIARFASNAQSGITACVSPTCKVSVHIARQRKNGASFSTLTTEQQLFHCGV
jgi:hypothetical protein